MSRLTCERPFEADRVNGTADFIPDWDVPSFGRAAAVALTRDVDAVRARPAPDPARKIHLLRGAPGYGKTHLFGRLRYAQGNSVQFVFVQSPPDPARAAEHAAWQVVETLFHSEDGGIAPIRVHLSRLLAPSFAAYFDQLPAGLRGRTAEERQVLTDDPLAVLQLASAVDDLVPYHALADVLRGKLPEVAGGVVRALVLGLSRASEDARTWLRGEAEQLPADRLATLRLGGQSPSPADVVRGASALCLLTRSPLVLCFDQLELLYLSSASGFRELTTQAMGWLQTVPNLVVVLGCVDETWETVSGAEGFRSFIARVAVHHLDHLAPDEAAELVIRRVRSWDEFDQGKPDGWPFDLDSVRRFVESKPVSPRGFVQTCRAAFDEWQVTGRRGIVQLSGKRPPVPLDEMFVQMWHEQLSATRKGLKSPNDYQEAELWEWVEEALKVARVGQPTPQGVRFEDYAPGALRRSPTDPRPSAELRMVMGTHRASVVLAVSKKDGGVAFGHWVGALDEALGGTVAGAVVVRPRAQLGAGRSTAAYKTYQGRVTSGSVRPFPLDENEDSFAQLECLRQTIRKARSGDLSINGQPVSEDDCRRLVVQTKLLAHLKLFDHLFRNWRALEPVRVPAGPAGPPAVPPQPLTPPAEARITASGVPHVATAPTAVLPPPPQQGPAPSGGPEWVDRLLATVVEKLRNKGQRVRPVGAEVGPTFVRLKVEPEDDADFGRVKKQADNLKLHLGLEHKPLIAAQAGFISIDVQRPDRQVLHLAPLLNERPTGLAGRPAFPAGVDVAGKAHWLDLADAGSCHLLVAGTTGSGKSEFLKSMLAALANHLRPDQLQFDLVDPKQVTFNLPGESPYVRGEVAHDVEAALPVIEDCLREMTRRYTLLRKAGKEHVGQLTGAEAVPRRMVVFDEFADLMADRQAKKNLEGLLKRLGAMGRAAGIHLVLGTQRPEANVVTPLLRDNLPARVGLMMAGERSSKLILEEPDAAYLLGRGDLFWRQGGGLLRLQSPFVSKAELEVALRCH